MLRLRANSVVLRQRRSPLIGIKAGEIGKLKRPKWGGMLVLHWHPSTPSEDL
jgi:hypothetical protein